MSFVNKERSEIAISSRPSFHGLWIHFYSTNLQFFVMFTLNDIFHMVLRVKVFLCCKHWRIIDRFSDPIIPIFSWQRHLYFVMNTNERNGCVITQRKVFRSLITWPLAVVIFGLRRVRFKIYTSTHIVLTVMRLLFS